MRKTVKFVSDRPCKLTDKTYQKAESLSRGITEKNWKHIIENVVVDTKNIVKKDFLAY